MSQTSNLSKLPEFCYAYREYDNSIVQIRRGEKGFYKVDYAVVKAESIKDYVNRLNEDLGVTKEQAQAMHVGSMFGWDVPGADPDVYKRPSQQQEQAAGDTFWEEKAYCLNNGEYYLHIQTCDDGYDYTIYCHDLSEYDGGQLDEPGFTMEEAAKSVLESFNLDSLPREEMDVDELQAAVEKYDITLDEIIEDARARHEAQPATDQPDKDRENERS